MKNILRTFSVVTFIFALIMLSGCGGDVAQSNTQEEVVTTAKSSSIDPLSNIYALPSSYKGTLLFFIFPDGSPCQQQNKILRDLVMPNTDSVNLQYVRTDVSSDQNIFYQYGIRSLPSLILLDKEQNIAKQFTPGIHGDEEILGEINKL